MTAVGPEAAQRDAVPAEAAAPAVGGGRRALRRRPTTGWLARAGAGDPTVAVAVPDDSSPVADRQLVLVIVIATAAARLAGPPAAWLVAALIGAAAFVGAAGIRSARPVARVGLGAVAAGLLPGVIAVAGALAIHAVGFGIELVAALAALGLLLSWSIGLERRLGAASTPPSDEDVATVLALSVAAGFVAFVGAGTLVEGGLARTGASPIPGDRLGVLVTADGLVAAILGARLALLRAATARNAFLAGASSGAFVAVTAGALRALAIPFLLGPALLALVFFLWDAVTGSTVARRRSPRWAWELGLLAVLGVTVALLNLRVT